MNSFHLFEPDRKIIFDITCCIGIMRQLHMIVEAVFLGRYSQALVPAHSFFLPVFVPLFLCTRPYKKLHFHLLKLTHSENKLPCYNLVPECFTYLRNSKRNFHSAGFLHIQKIYENALGC